MGGNRSASGWGGELAGGDLLTVAGGDCDIGEVVGERMLCVRRRGVAVAVVLAN